MFLNKDQVQALLAGLRKDAGDKIKGTTDIMFSLLHESDWSMVIKSHALIESLVTELIVAKIEEPKMKAVIERLPLSDDEIGKLRIAKDYHLLNPEERRFVGRLSQLRNQLVHKIENIDFSLEKYVLQLDKNQRKSWQDAFTWYEHGKNVNDFWRKAAIENPKLAVWFSVFMFVSVLSVDISGMQGQTSIRLKAEETTKEVIEKHILK